MMTFLVILLSLILLLIINYIVFRRSFCATLIETILRLKPNSRYKLDRLYSSKIASERNNYSAPKLKCDVSNYDVDGMPVYELGQGDRVVMYLHGGAYVAQPMIFQWRFATKLAKETGVKVVVPMYPLAPEHTYKDAKTKVTKLYKQLLKDYKQVVVIGDSAGGGLALALAQSWQGSKIDAPSKLILLSPWLDITLSNKLIPGLDVIDPMLSYKDLRNIGPLWAGELLTTDSFVSPINSDIIPSSKMYIFAGTREIFCPDCIDYYVKCKKANADVCLILGNGMNHVYPMYPIPEAHTAFKQICEIVLD